MPHILICTVGGSHQPIVTAIKEQRPDFVLFICTDKDPATGRPGSNSQVTGVGNCIKASLADEKPNLPNIPTQAGLTPEQYHICLTLSDDLDQIYLDCNLAIEAVVQRFSNARLIADYTGGTKSMSAGLVMAVMERQDIELQLVTGGRSDLVKVRDGSQSSESANIERIRFERQLAPYRQAWTRYAYSEAEYGLSQISKPRGNELRSQLNRFREVSLAFAEWDNFNHSIAVELLQTYAPALPNTLKAYLPLAMRLNDTKPEKREAAQLLDLYQNALRRASQGRYDDAIARVYRLLEWSAQWLLKNQCGIDTANVQANDIPEGIVLSQSRDGRWQAGLFAAWQLVKHKTTGEAAAFIQREEKYMQHHIKIRNLSILAHGFAPVTAQDWQAFHLWLEQQFMPCLLAETQGVGIKAMPLQLPQVYG